MVEILLHVREPGLQKKKTNQRIVRTKTMKKTLGVMLAAMMFVFSGTFVFEEYAVAAEETGRSGNYIAYDDGTVLDTSTKLMWAAKDNRLDIDWQGAKSYCTSYRGGGYTDWRMPTQDELAGLYDTNNNGYKSDCCDACIKIKTTELIHLSCYYIWTSKKRGSDAAYFDFGPGRRSWLYQSVDNYIRALPVRRAN
jgi:hypothetical protein